MKCNNCEAELEEGVTLCPECGCDNAPAEADQEPVVEETTPEEETPAQENVEKETTPIVEGKLTPGKIGLLVALAVVAIAVVVALIMAGMNGQQAADPADPTESDTTTPTSVSAEATDPSETTEATIPANGNPDDVTCKGTYSVTDEEAVAAKEAVVATLGEDQLTNAQLNVYYWMQFYEFNSTYGSYASYMGLDFTQPLDTQLGPDGTTTWQQYMLDASLEAWHTYSALAMEAEKAGFVLDTQYTDYLENLPDNMTATAAASGFESAQAMLESDMGPGVDIDAYMEYMHEYYTAYLYYTQLTGEITMTEAEIEAYFDENADTYAESGVEKNDDKYVDVRHILICPQGGTTDDNGVTTYSEDEWEVCRATAQAILDEWLEGDATEESFAALANERSEDGGSNTNGGLYENVYVGQMVEPFEAWCFDDSRQVGDSGLVQTDYGYHVMYYVGSTPIWYATAESDLYNQKSVQIMDDAMANYQRSVDYGSIVLGQVDFSTTETTTEG